MNGMKVYGEWYNTASATAQRSHPPSAIDPGKDVFDHCPLDAECLQIGCRIERQHDDESDNKHGFFQHNVL